MNKTHFLFLKIKLKTKQTMANTTPAAARRASTTMRGPVTATVSLIGIPSLGIPSNWSRDKHIEF